MKRVVILAMLLLAGCATDDSNIRKEMLARPDLAPDVRAAIEKEQIHKGMTKDEVAASWGYPCGYCYGTRQSSWGDSWEYNIFGTGSQGIGRGTYVYFGRDGRVTGWSN